MNQFSRLSRPRPQLPAELLDISHDEYERQLREAHYSDKALAAELARFDAFHAKFGPKPVARPAVEMDEEDPMVRAALRRRGKGRTKKEDEDA